MKRTPVMDVSGMLRSFRYAEATSLRSFVSRGDVEADDAGHARLVAWSRRLRRAMEWAYEVTDALNSRPDWIDIPLHGMLETLNET